MLDITNLTKVFARGTPNEHTALKNLSLHLDDGEFVTVIGSNGSGKSTLFNAVCGSFLPEKGAIRLGGLDITYLPEHRRARSIGRVFQDPMVGTASHMSIEENLALAYTRAHSGPFSMAMTRQKRELFAGALSRYGMGLEDRMKTKVGLLSGGQRQVVTLLMCTLVTPKLLLLDEHTAALDPAVAEKIMDITNRIISENRITAMMITHNIRAALTTGSRTVMMDSGEIILDLAGAARAGMGISQLMELYADRKKKELDNDRMLFPG